MENTLARWEVEEVRGLAQSILTGVRNATEFDSIDRDRLPVWFDAASIRAGWIDGSLVLAFEDAEKNTDTFEYLGEVFADTAVLLNLPSLRRLGWVMEFSGHDRLTYSAYGEGSPPLMSLPFGAAWSNAGLGTNHGPILVFGLSFQMDTSITDTSPSLMRHVPVALYACRDNQYNEHENVEWFVSAIIKELIRFVDSSPGETVARQRARALAFATTKEQSAIVLGAYSGSDLEELIQVRDYLSQKGYDAVLIRDLPEIPMMTSAEKVRLWAQASRFCVMVDRIPSGHISEYEILKQQNVILALLRPAGDRSTYMIGDDHLVDVNFINLFEFDRSPLQILDEAVEWAEAIAQEREKTYNALYPWREVYSTMKIKDKEFRNEEVRLDDAEFENCSFDRCTLIYGGSGPVSLVGSSFNNVKWVFADAAQNTLQFMTSLYHGAGEGGRLLVEDTFQNIRRGSHTQ